MQDLSDQALLRDYGVNRSEAAFAELVRRYVDLVYSVARRMTGDEDEARDVTQSVFVALARDAAKLRRHPVLAGWLHCTSRNLAANAVRRDVRRRAREQQAALMNEISSQEPEALWEQIAPVLDAALAELNQSDRDAVLLRYFQNKSVREVGKVLSASESAAQKRVNRAVERLRQIMVRNGIGITASGLTVAIANGAVKAAPAGLAAIVSATALQAIPITTTTVMATFQKILATAGVAAMIGMGFYAFQLRSEIDLLRQQQSALSAQLEQARRDRDDALRRLAFQAQANDKYQAGSHELARLRAEVARLREQKLKALSVSNAPVEETTSVTNVQVKLDMAIVSVSPEELQSLGIQWTPDTDGGGHGLLTADQRLEANNALQQVNTLVSRMSMVYVSGRHSIMNTSVALPGVPPPADPTDENTKAAITAANEINANIVLNMFPSYDAEDKHFDLSLVAELRQKTKDLVEEARQNLEGTYVQPVPQLQASNQVAVPHDQTVVLERDIPAGAWPIDYTNVPPPRKLIVFLTPVAIDSAGNLLAP